MLFLNLLHYINHLFVSQVPHNIGIDTFMTEEEDKTKFQKLYDQVMEILDWAEYQEYITLDARNILENNITETKEEIEKK